MVTYDVNLSNVQEIADEMGSIASYISNLLTELESSTSQDLARWASNAREAYNTATQVWAAKLSDMSAQATNAQASLSSIHDNYANAEYQGLGLWGA